MIVDKLKNYLLYIESNPQFEKAFEYLIKTDFSKIASGRYNLENSDTFVLVNEYQTKENESNMSENHQKYIDLQYIAEGNEVIEFETFKNQNVIHEYDEENDYALYSLKNPTRIKLEEGMFAIFYPEDLHMPGLIDKTNERVKKIVLKIVIK